MMQRILVVDDDREIVRLVRAYLEQSGYQVLVAYDGESALHVLRRESPALMVLDLMLPDRNGWDVMRIVRGDPALAATPVIMLAATLIALAYGDLLALLGTFAFGTFAAALAPALAVGLNWKRVTAKAAVASIATGMVLNLVLEFLAKQTYFPSLPKPPLAEGALPVAFSLAVSFAVLLVVSVVTGKDERSAV